jgi:hypothetical protein
MKRRRCRNSQEELSGHVGHLEKKAGRMRVGQEELWPAILRKFWWD